MLLVRYFWNTHTAEEFLDLNLRIISEIKLGCDIVYEKQYITSAILFESHLL